MDKCRIIMNNGKQYEVTGTAEEVKKKYLNNSDNDLVLIDGHYIKPSQISNIDDMFVHSMMPDIEGIKTDW